MLDLWVIHHDGLLQIRPTDAPRRRDLPKASEPPEHGRHEPGKEKPRVHRAPMLLVFLVPEPQPPPGRAHLLRLARVPHMVRPRVRDRRRVRRYERTDGYRHLRQAPAGVQRLDMTAVFFG
jgi:hypothetical protein